MPSSTLLDLRLDELEERLSDLPRYRAAQIWQGTYRTLASSYDEITTIPLPLRVRLAADLPFPTLEPVEEATGENGSVCKHLFRLADGETIESVSMEYPDRASVCVSSQVGCAVGCPFCATGQAGFVRDLTAGEIVAQVLHSARWFRARGRRLSHVVYMGMGEPLLNYEATIRSIRILNDHEGFDLGARSFTVSTSGVAPAIERLAADAPQVNLAVSLHAADDRTRDQLVPINRRYPLATLLRTIRAYVDRTHRRVTFEIALLEGVNDAEANAAAAAKLLTGLLCHVNLIPYNATPNSASRRSPEDRIRRFRDVLEAAGIPVTVRKSMGTDIEAGCGQLRARVLKGSRTSGRSRPATP